MKKDSRRKGLSLEMIIISVMLLVLTFAAIVVGYIIFISSKTSYTYEVEKTKTNFGIDTALAENKSDVSTYKTSQKTDENGFREFENPDENIIHDAFTYEYGERRVNIEKYKYTDFDNDKVIIYLHGGSYINKMSDKEEPYMKGLLKYGGGATVYMIDYAVLDEFKEGIKTPLDDITGFYYKLILEDGIKPENIIFAGNDSGASLVLRACGYMKEVLNDTRYPAGLILIAPYNNPKDMTDTFHKDIYRLLSENCKCFEYDIKELIHEDLPKTLIICGTEDIMYLQSQSLKEDLLSLNVDANGVFYDGYGENFMLLEEKEERGAVRAWHEAGDFIYDIFYTYDENGE